MATPYLEEVNLAVMRLIGREGLILDVGCGTGINGHSLRALGNRVHGIEIDPDAARVARGRLDLVHCGDATRFADLPPEIREARYDVILLADVLEHLVDPEGFLVAVTGSPLVSERTRLVVSLPNVAVWSMRLGLLFGDFTYGDSGILDRSHLRFFTRKTARALLRSAGFTIEREDLTPSLVRAALPLVKTLMKGEGGDGTPDRLLRSPAYQFYKHWVLPAETALCRLRPPLLAFQIVFTARPARFARPG
jgi:2-polyprenyl-3-methyl-5-hydroxy-6-metoxy-1,4-benzoquinol methylase